MELEIAHKSFDIQSYTCAPRELGIIYEWLGQLATMSDPSLGIGEVRTLCPKDMRTYEN